MTPQEKAQELIQKFMDVDLPVWSNHATLGREAAKQCAEICVDEILECHMFKKNQNSGARTFWLNVKKSIQENQK